MGQYVSVGATLAEVHALDAVELRLPVPDAELAFLELPWLLPPAAAADAGDTGSDGTGSDGAPGPRVELSADFAGRRWTWAGRIVRIESEIDRMTRMLHLVARVEQPFAPGDDGRPPLTPGMFVEARIHGRSRPDSLVLPRSALREGDRVLVVDADDRLRLRDVDVLRSERERVVLAGGLLPGERVVVSLLEVVTDGMLVRPAEVAP